MVLALYTIVVASDLRLGALVRYGMLPVCSKIIEEREQAKIPYSLFIAFGRVKGSRGMNSREKKICMVERMQKHVTLIHRRDVVLRCSHPLQLLSRHLGFAVVGRAGA